MQTIKPCTLSKVTFKSHTRSSATSSFIGFSIGDQKSGQYLFSDKTAEMTLKVY